MVGAGDDEAEGVDRIAGVGRQHDVARRGDRRGEAGEPFLRSHRHHHFGFGIELDPEAAAVVIGLGLAHAGDARGGGIAVRVGLPRDFAQLVDHMLGRRQVGVAHAEVDDVPPRPACCVPHRVDFGDDVGRQALDAVELVFHDLGNSRWSS
jgi:hypothetical protein